MYLHKICWLLAVAFVCVNARAVRRKRIRTIPSKSANLYQPRVLDSPCNCKYCPEPTYSCLDTQNLVLGEVTKCGCNTGNPYIDGCGCLNTVLPPGINSPINIIPSIKLPTLYDLPCSYQSAMPSYQMIEPLNSFVADYPIEMASSVLSLPYVEPLIPNCGCQLPNCGCQLPNCGCQLPNCGCQLPKCGCQLPNCGCQLPSCGCQLPICGCQVPDCACQLPNCGCQIQSYGTQSPCGNRQTVIKTVIKSDCQNLPCQNCVQLRNCDCGCQLPVMDLPCVQLPSLELPVCGGCQLPSPGYGCGKYLRQVTLQPPFV